jgi:Holliday junction DNA helicase RuvB
MVKELNSQIMILNLLNKRDRMEDDFVIHGGQVNEEDKEIEKSIRPKSFSDFNGQEKLIDNLKVFVEAAKMRDEALDHVILSGPPGLGKTTLANIISNELNSNIKVTSGPVLEKAGDLAGILTNLEKHDVLFIDEIHRLNPAVEEFLYSAMEDYKIDLIIDKGPGARSIQLNLNPFTLVGATTRAGLLSSPLRARFGINMHLEYYDTAILEKIVKRSAKLLNIVISETAAIEIASRSRGTPRIANSLLRRVRDFTQVRKMKEINTEITEYALEALNIDKNGLDEMDNRILLTIIEKFNGGPVGISTIATAVSEDAGTIEEVYEPFLIKEGYLKRTPRGREVTPLTYKHLGKDRPGDLTLQFG